VAELVDLHRFVEVFEPMFTELGHGRIDQFAGLTREQHLATVPGCGDPSCLMNVASDVALVRHKRSPSVESYSHPDGTVGQGVLRDHRGLDRIPGVPEGDEERVALGVDLDATTTCERFSDQPPMLREGFRVLMLAQYMQQPGRTFHVCEQEGDSARGKLAPHAEMMRQEQFRCSAVAAL